ncbi:hypothetical protein ADUPG1_010992, partial [Aduncisulcus paluster]
MIVTIIIILVVLGLLGVCSFGKNKEDVKFIHKFFGGKGKGKGHKKEGHGFAFGKDKGHKKGKGHKVLLITDIEKRIQQLKEREYIISSIKLYLWLKRFAFFHSIPFIESPNAYDGKTYDCYYPLANGKLLLAIISIVERDFHSKDISSSSISNRSFWRADLVKFINYCKDKYQKAPLVSPFKVFDPEDIVDRANLPRVVCSILSLAEEHWESIGGPMINEIDVETAEKSSSKYAGFVSYKFYIEYSSSEGAELTETASDYMDGHELDNMDDFLDQLPPPRSIDAIPEIGIVCKEEEGETTSKQCRNCILLESQLDHYKLLLSTYEKTVDEYEIDTLETKNAELSKELASLRIELATSESTNSILQDKITSLTAEVQKHSSTLSEKSDNVEDLRTRLADSESRVVRLKRDNDELKTTLEGAQFELGESQHRLAESQHNLELKDEEIKKIQG